MNLGLVEREGISRLQTQRLCLCGAGLNGICPCSHGQHIELQSQQDPGKKAHTARMVEGVEHGKGTSGQYRHATGSEGTAMGISGRISVVKKRNPGSIEDRGSVLHLTSFEVADLAVRWNQLLHHS